MQKRKPARSKKRLVFISLAVLLVGAIATWLLVPNSSRDRLFNLNSDEKESEAQTTSTTPTAQSNYSEGEDREVNNQDKNEGVVVDNQGSVSEVPDASSWTSSKSGEITVYNPAKNAILKSGNTLTGTSSLSSVSFRLIDDVSGVIAQGEVAVVNGKFSGTFNFSTSASEGRLDIFGVQGDGVEFSNVEIPIRFK